MNKEKQIKEMTNDICDIEYKGMKCYDNCEQQCDCRMFAEALYNAGYHKQVTGEWKLGKGGTMYSCSYCDYKAFPREVDEWTFCPRCGAKMKGE